MDFLMRFLKKYFPVYLLVVSLFVGSATIMTRTVTAIAEALPIPRNVTIVIDPGHGGCDPGAVYNGRQEMDDVLRLGKAVGALLEARGVDVVYTRDGDFYETPFKKAQDGNNVGADYFVSIHRNSSEYPDQ